MAKARDRKAGKARNRVATKTRISMIRLKPKYLKASVAGIRKASEIIAEEIVSRAPRDTGEFAATIRAINPRIKENRIVGGVNIPDGPGREHIAVWHEYGTIHMAAHPFVRPGTEAARGAARAAIIDELKKVN